MNRDDMRELVSQLEALEALATLFNNLWFDHIKRDIRDQKVQAYLMVFEDAFPHLNHVVEFVRRSAGVLSAGKASQDNWAHLQREFETLRLLLSRREPEQGSARPAVGEPAAGSGLTVEEREALEAVDQSDLDALFRDRSPSRSVDEEASEVGNGIDALFTRRRGDVPPAEDGMDALFEEEAREEGAVEEDDFPGELEEDVEIEESEDQPPVSIAAEMIGEDEDLDEEDALAAAAALEQEVSAEGEEEDAGTGEARSGAAGADGADEDLESLLEGVEDEEPLEEEVELEDLLDEEEGEEESEEGADEDAEEAPQELLEDEEGGEDELEDLLGEGEAEGDGGDELEEDDLAAGISDDEMSALLEDEGATEHGADDGADGEEELSEDEIDKLFG